MSQLCLSVQSNDFEYCRALVQGFMQDVVEIRLEPCDWKEEQLKELFSCERNVKLMASFVNPTQLNLTSAVERLSMAILSGADYVDISLAIPEPSRRWLMTLAMNKGCKIILSYHNFSCTPQVDALRKIAEDAFKEGADIVKVVTTAEGAEDCERILSLYRHFPEGRLEAFAMGEPGSQTRIEAVTQHKAPFIYLAPGRETRTAPGQYTVYDFWEEEDIPLQGDVARLPASKSFAQRAIILAALCTGTTRLYRYTPCADNEAALRVAEQLGAEITREGDTLVITGHQDIPNKGLVLKDDTIFVGESALLARLCIPLAGLARRPVTITGEKTLLRRWVCPYKTLLAQFGLKVEGERTGFLPLTVSGTLRPSPLTPVNGKHGSQIISGLLIALSLCPSRNHLPTFLRIHHLTSRFYLDLTCEVMGYFGLEVPDFPEEQDESTERTYFFGTGQRVRPVVGLACEADWSAAALMMAAGAAMGDVTLHGLNLNSLQPDAEMYDLLVEQNSDLVRYENGDINIRKGLTVPFDYDITDTPDLLGALIILALRANGESCISGLERLRNKESDRAKTFVEEFRAIGADLFIAEDGKLYIEGSPSQLLEGGRCSSHGDHRLAMALAVADGMSRKKVVVDDIACSGKSWPEFPEELDKLFGNKRK